MSLELEKNVPLSEDTLLQKVEYVIFVIIFPLLISSPVCLS